MLIGLSVGFLFHRKEFEAFSEARIMEYLWNMQKQFYKRLSPNCHFVSVSLRANSSHVMAGRVSPVGQPSDGQGSAGEGS